MAKYIKKEMADLHGTGSTQVYYRMERGETLSYGDFIRRCHRYHQLCSPSVILSVVTAVCEQLATELADGNNVRIDGLGTFHAKLGLNKYSSRTEMDTFEEGAPRLNATSLGVTGVGFKADKELVISVAGKCRLERGGEDRIRKPKYAKADRIERAIRFLRREGFMHVRDYATLNGLSYSSAYLELKNDLEGESAFIRSRGTKSAKIYYLVEKPTPDGLGLE